MHLKPILCPSQDTLPYVLNPLPMIWYLAFHCVYYKFTAASMIHTCERIVLLNMFKALHKINEFF